MAALTDVAPTWPESTRGLSQIRLGLRFKPKGFLRTRLRRTATLNLDIVDYPGEWLLDLPLLQRSFADWSREALDLAHRPPRAALARDWLQYLSMRAPRAPGDEAEVRRLAELYPSYLRACRDSDAQLSLLQDGKRVLEGKSGSVR